MNARDVLLVLAVLSWALLPAMASDDVVMKQRIHVVLDADRVELCAVGHEGEVPTQMTVSVAVEHDSNQWEVSARSWHLT
jgi:hypothetical protein